MSDEFGGDLAAAHGDEAQSAELCRQGRGIEAQGQQQAQQLGYQHQAVAGPAQQCMGQGRRIQLAGAREAEFPQGGDAAAGAGQQRYIQAGQVLQQGGEGQQGQVFLNPGRGHPQGKGSADRRHLFQRQADALGLPRGARGIGDLGGACWQLGEAGRDAAPQGHGLLIGPACHEHEG